MIRIAVMNAKGGCGKTTVAINLASFYALSNHSVALFDGDQQGSSMRWLRQRPENLPVIHGIAAHQAGPMNVTRTWQLRVPAETTRSIVDTAAGLKGLELATQVKNMDVILVPVVPSSIDIFSTADFIRDLMLIGKVQLPHTRIGIVANRIKANTLAFQSLERFLRRLNIPVVARLRDTQHYVHAAEHGSSVHELTSKRAQQDKTPWVEMYQWIESTPDRRLALVQPTDSNVAGNNQGSKNLSRER